MVITRIMGGLGNQLFQYAAGRRIAVANNDRLTLDTSTYEISERPYRLDRFNIVEDVAPPAEIRRLTGISDRNRFCARLTRKLAGYARKYLPAGRTSVIRERDTRFDPDVPKATGDVYLDGYWQSELYFEDIKDVIRNEFTLKDAPDAVNQDMCSTIGGCDSVSLHVRRGDYVSNPLYNQVHGACPLEYYSAAVALLIKTVKDPRFFVFFDDPEWVRQNLKLDYPTMYVNHNGEDKDYEDLRLMSLCRHHIIANSSFSWWGAWLCANPDKIVIAPKQWFNDPSKDATDIVPDSWQRA